MGKNLELAIGVLNGAIGDYLARTGNGLATPMELVHEGAPIALDPASLAHAHPAATPRAVLFIPGVMCTESVWDFPDGAGDYGTFLARDTDLTPLYLRYNTGLAIPDNGAELARLLDALVGAYPVPLEEIVLVGFSMGGLVARSACHAASMSGASWLSLVKRAFYLGTPHLGAPYERLGRVVTKVLRGVGHAVGDPYTRLIADIADLRSDGVKDLGDADVRHEDRARRRLNIALRDPRHPVPLLPAIDHYVIAGALITDPRIASLFGDALVPLPSATKEGSLIPKSHVRVMDGLAHMTLAHHADVYAQLRAWLDDGADAEDT